MYGDQLGSATVDDGRHGSRRPPVATRSDRRRRPLVAYTAGLLLFVAGIAVGATAARSATGAIAAAAPTATVTAAPESPDTAGRDNIASAAEDPDPAIADGDWFIGGQVRPGSYRNISADCYWARLSGTSGTLAEIIANGIGPGVVTIEPGDYAFTSNRCNWAFLG